MPRTPLIVGNWKMHTGREEAVRLATAIAAGDVPGVELAVCPPFPWLVPVATALVGSTVGLGAQNCWTEESGAFTGEVSPTMLAELCRYVIVGHSERRRILGENDDAVRRKLTAALAAGLTPILCVGEDLDMREAGHATAFVGAQLESALSLRSDADVCRCVIAYEPIWAIGTGIAAQPADAEEMASEIRAVLGSLAGGNAGERIYILYGGSVSPANAAAILAGGNVDGALVGGASLKADSFLAIAAAAV
ncbi:MAG TPA: triose-phosphate isomerase [Thermomicrobiales bacterium]|jgi:triosephosphate isomerase